MNKIISDCHNLGLNHLFNFNEIGDQSYLMIHLLTFANLLVQFQHKNNASSFSQYIYTMTHLPYEMYKCYLTI